MKKAYLSLVVAIAMVASAPLLKANALTPGTSGVTPDSLPVGSYGLGGPETLVASMFDQPFSGTANGLTISGTYDAVVLEDTGGGVGNGLCVGCMNFEYQIDTNTGTDAIATVALSNFLGFTLDAGYDPSFCGIDDCPSGTAQTPSSMGETLAGTVNFDFATLASPNGTVILEVETNATSFSPGTISFIDSGVVSGPGFAPAVPEPATAGLLALGLLVLGAGTIFRKRRTEMA